MNNKCYLVIGLTSNREERVVAVYDTKELASKKAEELVEDFFQGYEWCEIQELTMNCGNANDRLLWIVSRTRNGVKEILLTC